MQRIQLLTWDPEDSDAAMERFASLRAAGYRVEHLVPEGPATLRAMARNSAAAVIIDLSRRPATGRDLGLAIRVRKNTRNIPIVFAGGNEETVARIRDLLPDAAFTTWDRIDAAVASAITHSPVNPVVPPSGMQSYAGTPLPKKLGIKSGSSVALTGAPPGFERTLGDLPEGADVRRRKGGGGEVTLWFVRSRRDLEDGMPLMKSSGEKGGLWIRWPKKASGVVSDLSQDAVRQAGLTAGLVDFKIASIDETWSGLRFSCRKQV